MSDERIDKVKAIISQSGNTFHSSVLQYLNNKGWTVLISPYYNDNISNKPREIDLIAEKEFKRTNSFGSPDGTVNVRLFIECKYISQINVFWFHWKDKQQAMKLLTQIAPFRENNTYTEAHHYLVNRNRVAKLFSDERSKSAENEIFYKALNQCLNAMVYYRHRESIINKHGSRNRIALTFNYPVILCNNFENLFRVEMESETEPKKINTNFQLEVNYAYVATGGNNMNEYFLIDIINFDNLDSYLEEVENDARIVNHFIEE